MQVFPCTLQMKMRRLRPDGHAPPRIPVASFHSYLGDMPAQPATINLLPGLPAHPATFQRAVDIQPGLPGARLHGFHVDMKKAAEVVEGELIARLEGKPQICLEFEGISQGFWRRGQNGEQMALSGSAQLQ